MSRFRALRFALPWLLGACTDHPLLAPDPKPEEETDKLVPNQVVQPDTLTSLAHFGHHRHFTGAGSVLLFGGGVKKGHAHGETGDPYPLGVDRPVDLPAPGVGGDQHAARPRPDTGPAQGMQINDPALDRPEDRMPLALGTGRCAAAFPLDTPAPRGSPKHRGPERRAGLLLRRSRHTVIARRPNHRRPVGQRECAAATTLP